MIASTRNTDGMKDSWPELRLQDWQDTYATLHMWTQIVGKLRLHYCSPVNHWWHTALYLTARGLTTSPIPYGNRTFQADFDFVDHCLLVSTSDGEVRTLDLAPMAVADFYRSLKEILRGVGIEAEIWTMPQEVPNPIPFEKDTVHAAYDPEYAGRCWRILVQADRVFKDFRSRFIGKVSPVHFFWGSFDLAVTRFSGRRAPEHPGGGLLPTWVTRESYSHEVISCGFWPGGGSIEASFYAYAYPEPDGFRKAAIRPAAAYYTPELGEYLLPYEAVRVAGSPDDTLMEFLQTTYAAAADLGHWDRAELERPGTL
jgi:hypothetical protein